jgi:hypothetical protein
MKTKIIMLLALGILTIGSCKKEEVDKVDEELCDSLRNELDIVKQQLDEFYDTYYVEVGSRANSPYYEESGCPDNQYCLDEQTMTYPCCAPSYAWKDEIKNMETELQDKQTNLENTMVDNKCSDIW